MGKGLAGLLAGTIVVFGVILPVSAEEPAAVLDKADIQVVATDMGYIVTENVHIADAEGLPDESITHTLSKILGSQVEDVVFESDGAELPVEVEAGEYLDRYLVGDMAGSDGAVEYTITYSVPKVEDNFNVPLFVPDVATMNEERVVHVAFKAPDGAEIQKNSFPAVIKSGQNEADKHMANIPAKLNYVYSTEPTVMHSYNIVSAIAIIALLLLLGGWGFVETRKKEGVL